MGLIKHRLGAVANELDLNEHAENRVGNQLERAGETIESEFKTLTDRIRALEKEQVNLFEMLAQRTKRIEALEEKQRAIDFYIESDKKEDTVSTDKDKPKFQVGDTIALCDYGDKRIVLEVKPDNFMRLMNVPSGYIQESCFPKQYTLVYRPEHSESKG